MSKDKPVSVLDNCLGGKHSLVPVYQREVDEDITHVVRWCKICGAMVVDEDTEKRVIPGKVMKMRATFLLAEITRNRKEEN